MHPTTPGLWTRFRDWLARAGLMRPADYGYPGTRREVIIPKAPEARERVPKR